MAGDGIKGQGLVLLGEESEGRMARYLERFKNLVCIVGGFPFPLRFRLWAKGLGE